MRKTDNSIFVYLACAVLLLCFAIPQVFANPPSDYPVPPDSDIRLFYLQNSTNPNTVVYDANVLSNGQLNPKQPIDIYWLRYNTNGVKKGLNFAERNLVYGLNFDSIGKTKSYVITLMAYSGRIIIVSLGPDGKAIAKVKISGKMSKLKNIFINVSGSGFFSSINYIELMGVDLASGKSAIERFQPEEDIDD